MTNKILEIVNLRTKFHIEGSKIEVVRGVDMAMERGEILGLIGESGSGKTMTGLSIARLLPNNAAVSATTLTFAGTSLLDMADIEFDHLRGVGIAMIFQDPATSLNPSKTIGWHLSQVFHRATASIPRNGQIAGRQKDALKVLSEVGIAKAASVLTMYPHQLSGGMLQRVMIAAVLALEPGLIIADEPTTNLDKLIEKQIVILLRELRDRLSTSFIFITHDIALAASLCDRIAVMYAGQIVEIGPTDRVLNAPMHPYTRGLVRVATNQVRGGRLSDIAGEPPNSNRLPGGCPFEPRCENAFSQCCAIQPSMVETTPRHSARCLLYG